MRASSKYGPMYKSFCRLDLVAGMVDDIEDIVVVGIDAINGKAIDDCVDGLMIECDRNGNGIDNDVINRFWCFDIIVASVGISIWFCSKSVDFDKFGPMVEVDWIGVVMVSNQREHKHGNDIEGFVFRSKNCSNFEFDWMAPASSVIRSKRNNRIRNI